MCICAVLSYRRHPRGNTLNFIKCYRALASSNKNNTYLVGWPQIIWDNRGGIQVLNVGT